MKREDTLNNYDKSVDNNILQSLKKALSFNRPPSISTIERARAQAGANFNSNATEFASPAGSRVNSLRLQASLQNRSRKSSLRASRDNSVLFYDEATNRLSLVDPSDICLDEEPQYCGPDVKYVPNKGITVGKFARLHHYVT